MGTGLFDFIAQACRSLAATAAPSITAMGIHVEEERRIFNHAVPLGERVGEPCPSLPRSHAYFDRHSAPASNF